MFWLRFFGSRVRDNNATSALTFTPQDARSSAKSQPYESCIFQITEDNTFPEEGIKSRGGRRSAIDLSTTNYSLDIGPQSVYRMSFDTFANPSYQLTSLLKGFADFQTLHRGSRARILKASKKTTNEDVVLKVYDKGKLCPSQLDDVSKELEILRKHCFDYGMVELLDVFEDDRLILLNLKEYSNGTLMACVDDHGGFLTEDLCVKYVAAPLVKTLARLHGAGIVHRNIKPEHILFDGNYKPSLCDFLSAAVVGRDTLTDREGTLSYMAPEMVVKPTPEEIFHIVLSRGVDEADLPRYNEKVDIWSLGVVIVEALTGMLPFVSDTADGLVAAHRRHFSGESYSAPLRQLETSGQLSEEGIDFISKVLQADPNDRPDAASLLSHPWLQISS